MENIFITLTMQMLAASHPCRINVLFLEIFLVNPRSFDSSKRVT